MTKNPYEKGEARASVCELMATSAIEAHVRWKVRLEAHIDGSGRERLDPGEIEKDNLCPLGVWIYGSGSTHFGESEQFAELKRAHAEFHRCAADIVRVADAGDGTKAMKMLSEGEYAKSSSLVKAMLNRVWMELDNK